MAAAIDEQVERTAKLWPELYAQLQCDALNKYRDAFTLRDGNATAWAARSPLPAVAALVSDRPRI
jgi:hypothetical protein